MHDLALQVAVIDNIKINQCQGAGSGGSKVHCGRAAEAAYTEALQVDWLLAARHFALAEEPVLAMEVLGSAASEALGTGAWGAAVEIIELMPAATPPAAIGCLSLFFALFAILC